MAIKYVCDKCSTELTTGAEGNFASVSNLRKTLTYDGNEFQIRINSTARENKDAVLCKACWCELLISELQDTAKETFEQKTAPEEA